MTTTRAGILLFVFSFALSALLTAAVKKLAISANFISRPTADRYKKTTTPLGGGIAIVVTFLTAAALTLFCLAYVRPLGTALDVKVWHNSNALENAANQLLLLMCVLMLFILGLWDDKKQLGPIIKLILQFIVAFLAATLADVRVELFIENKIATTALSALWMVLIINAFNFLDNMDGLAAGIAAIASCILLFAAAISQETFTCILAIIFIGALAGFLLFNFPPAKIFMGDAGSLPLGFIVAVFTLRTTYYQEAAGTHTYPIFLPALVMAVPLYDFISVSLIRICQGKSPLVGDTQHFSHRLKNRGLTDTQTVLTLYLATLCTGLGATFLYQVNLAGAILIFTQTFMILAIIAIFETTGPNEKTK